MGKSRQKLFDRIINKFQNAENNNLQARPEGGSSVYFNESYKLIQDISYSKITHEETLERITSIRDDIDKVISQETLIVNQVKVLNVSFMVDEIFTGKIKFVKASNEGVLEIFEQESILFFVQIKKTYKTTLQKFD